LKILGAPSIIEYRSPKMILESISVETREGKTVLKSIIDIVKVRKNPCQIKTRYDFFNDLSIEKLLAKFI
jgi:hypothetical protein